MSRALLDVNVLLALYDSDHVHHDAAHDWFGAAKDRGWATCAITENGFVRVLSQGRYPNPVPVAEAVSLLEHARASAFHEFWACDLSIVDPRTFERTRIHGAGQLTDAYLLALATARRGRLATFDRNIALAAVPGATEDNLVVL